MSGLLTSIEFYPTNRFGIIQRGGENYDTLHRPP